LSGFYASSRLLPDERRPIIEGRRMRASNAARAVVLGLFALALFPGASALLAAEPTGDSPSNGLAVTCQVESTASGSTLWYKIPYHPGTQLEIDLTAIDGVYFDVYSPDQVRDWPTLDQSLGRSVPKPADPIYLKSWQGQLVQSDYVLDYYYVRLTNTIGIKVIYQLCFKETQSEIVEPTGDSPADGLITTSCLLQSLDPNTQIWHKVPYHTGKELEIYLKTIFADLNFDVFTPDQIQAWPILGQPIGRGTPNIDEPEYADSWQGHLPDSGYYYVRVTNASAVQVHYQLCADEKELSGPLPPTPISITPTPRSRSRF
jgi:hypothetical protein